MKTKKKKPVFRRTEHTRRNLKKKWRRPRGCHNKMKIGIKGRGSTPSIGYKNPDVIRGLVKGLKPLMIYNVADASKADPKNNIAIIGSAVGKKKRMEILAKAEELGLAVANSPKEMKRRLKC